MLPNINQPASYAKQQLFRADSTLHLEQTRLQKLKEYVHQNNTLERCTSNQNQRRQSASALAEETRYNLNLKNSNIQNYHSCQLQKQTILREIKQNTFMKQDELLEYARSRSTSAKNQTKIAEDKIRYERELEVNQKRLANQITRTQKQRKEMEINQKRNQTREQNIGAEGQFWESRADVIEKTKRNLDRIYKEQQAVRMLAMKNK
ncbi:Hypothetical_protein [Hexamita inflata]|uniref:Hypothetical_protein n=1 Tax=Hexamita inflata TaxID=28002 RepID=A0AA86RIG5_9EUKA|nr:Hypothetical protein HINF_LOCUS605 [Hexamita inflata]CAI9934883.1 Hypothetical protein HINF_LOCUS22528 [Hexamita inflata]CAI9974133.1 Hypothetical protein HINF_LOCUS61778 [Hexamita inflata]